MWKGTNSDGKFNCAKFNVQSPEYTIVRQKLFNVVLNLEKIQTEYKLF